MDFDKLSTEQQRFIQQALQGFNILVDACIGSGKTTAIQTLCNYMPNKKILYLTYNKLLKLDAKNRIRNGNVIVTNYHGFAWGELNRIGIKAGIEDLITTYNQVLPPCSRYDVLILDEYQDIEREIGDMLFHIKDCCPGMQIIAVGDMEQKIYDKTRLDVQEFIQRFLGDYQPVEFTKCFRIGKDHAAMLGRVWNKPITGVNEDFKVVTMSQYEIEDFVCGLNPNQLLVLGKNGGKRTKLQNYLEENHANKFNKHTVWSKISDLAQSTSPTPDCAIFTTYDGCKGMERDICVLYDWSWDYWYARMSKPDKKYEIIRNIFCVAASRAKQLLIVANTVDPLTEDTLCDPEFEESSYMDMPISKMFDFKFIEDIDAAYGCLKIEEIQPVSDIINVPIKDGLIELSFCIGNFQEAMYFEGYNIDQSIEYYLEHPDRTHMKRAYHKYTIDQKILYLAAIETMQWRYCGQVAWPIVSEDDRKQISERLSTHLPKDCKVQQPCQLPFSDGTQLLFHAYGILDAIQDNIVYELKFVSALSHVHMLQLAMYLVCTGYRKGRLWNVRTNQMYEIEVPKRKEFLDKVMAAVTKGSFLTYFANTATLCEEFYKQHSFLCNMFLKEMDGKNKIAPAEVVEYFKSHGLQLPASGSTFLMYIRRFSKIRS